MLTVVLIDRTSATEAQWTSLSHSKVRVHSFWQHNSDAWIGLEFEFKPGWHGYFENPGDSGMALIVGLNSESGSVTIKQYNYPLPHRHSMGPITNYVYENRLFLPFSLHTKAESKLDLKIKLEYLVCEDSCVPQFAEVDFSMQKGEFSPDWDRLSGSFQFASERVEGLYKRSGKIITASYPNLALASEVFPDRNIFNPGTLLQTAFRDNRVFLRFEINSGEQHGEFEALVKSEQGLIRVQFAEGSVDDALLNFKAINDPQVEQESESNYWTILLMAFIGGLLLNVMPCIFPVISLKLMHLGQVGSEAESRWAPWMYMLGVVSSFCALGLILEVLRRGGEQIGWGFQLQNMPFVACMALLFYVVALNLAGLFEIQFAIGSGPQGTGNWNNFLTGVLASLVATPCTAPFMATALGYALFLEHELQRMLLFACLGFGMAFPIWIFELSSSARKCAARILPRPGPWMIHFRKILAYPMFLTSLWLLWVLVRQSDLSALFVILVIMISLAANLQLYQASFHWNWRIRKLLFALILVQFIITAVFFHQTTNHAGNSGFNYSKFEPEKLSMLVESGRKVFVIATADWCVSCKFNERLVLKTDRMEAFYKEQGIEVLIADWTSRDDQITSYLARFNRAGVPLYVYYEGGQVQVLPQILNDRIVRESLARKKEIK